MSLNLNVGIWGKNMVNINHINPQICPFNLRSRSSYVASGLQKSGYEEVPGQHQPGKSAVLKQMGDLKP